MKVKRILISVSCILIFSSVSANAYDTRKFVDGMLFNDPNYEYDWGSCFSIGDDYYKGSLESDNFEYSSDSANAIAGNGSRFSHWCNKESNTQGWVGAGGWHWVYPNEKYSNNKLSKWDVYWDLGEGNPNFPDTVFKRIGVINSSQYNSENNYAPWGYANGHPLCWGRWGIGYYKREKPVPYPGIPYIKFEDDINKYSELGKKILWTQPSKVDYDANAIDCYPNNYGTSVVEQAGIRQLNMGIYGNDINYAINIDRDDCDGLGVYKDIGAVNSIKTNSYKIIKASSGFSNDYYQDLNGVRKYGSEGQMSFYAMDGGDYTPVFNAADKWNKWISDNHLNYNLFKTGTGVWLKGFKNGSVNGDGMYETLKVDGQPPTWEKEEINTEAIDSTTITLVNIADYRGNAKLEGVGVDNGKITVYPKGHPELKTVTALQLDKSNKTMKATFNYSNKQMKYYGDYVLEIQVADHLNNISNKKISFVRPDPKPVNANLNVVKYKYREGNTYWVNTKEDFTISTSIISTFSFNDFPTETVLMMGNSSKYSNSYPGTMLISSINSLNITAGKEKNVYIDKNSNYLARRSSIGNIKMLTSFHNLKAKDSANNKRYKLHTIGRTYYSKTNKWYNSEPFSSSSVLAIDSMAPTAEFKMGEREDDYFMLNISNLSDNGGSGVKSISVRVTNDNGTEKDYTLEQQGNNSSIRIDKNDFSGAINGYSAVLTMTDKVDNVSKKALNNLSMVQNNLTANNIKIYDPVDNRYVTQVISGYQYEAEVEIENTGERNINKSFTVGLEIDGQFYQKQLVAAGIRRSEKQLYKFKFTAGEENLKGVKYTGIVDYDNNIVETNEDDNTCSTPEPYDKVPEIPEQPTNNPPVQTIILDYEAEYIDTVRLDSEEVLDELQTGEAYRVKFKVKNNSSYPLKYLDILKKKFICKTYYDNIDCGTFEINEDNDIPISKDTILYGNIKVPELENDQVECIKQIKGVVDVFNDIRETNEDNNIINNNKSIIGLKVTDYRIVNIINPPESYTYPIMIESMPASVNAGYNVTFRCNVRGRADKVYAELSDSTGKIYDTQYMTKVKDIDSVTAEYEYTFTVPLDTAKGTIVFSKIYAAKGLSSYDYNLREAWDGKTLSIGGTAESDIVVFRQY